MGLLQLCGVALVGGMLMLFLKELRPAMLPPLRLAVSLLLLGCALALYAPLLSRVQELLQSTGVGEYADVLLRALGIALICELTAILCEDLGEPGVARGIHIFGKLEILVLSLPLVDKVLELAKELLQY